MIEADEIPSCQTDLDPGFDIFRVSTEGSIDYSASVPIPALKQKCELCGEPTTLQWSRITRGELAFGNREITAEVFPSSFCSPCDWERPSFEAGLRVLSASFIQARALGDHYISDQILDAMFQGLKNRREMNGNNGTQEVTVSAAK